MHKLLERQIKRLLGGDPSGVPEDLLEAVDQAYRQADEDRVLLERAMELTSQELLERYEQLRREVAERSRLEDRVLQSQKMEAVGQLAGGIAHDFNNLLTVIRASCKLCRSRLEQAGDEQAGNQHRQLLEEDLTQIADAAQSAADLTGQLLAYSRQQVLDPQVLDLNRTLERLEEMLGRLIGEHELVLELEAEPATVLADEGRIQQAVMNLVLNARDAMPGGGEITLRTENLEIDDDSLFPFDLEEPPRGRVVLVAVHDTGPGIDPAVRRRIFEPFFTTKDRGAGTGLGLATVYGIVKQSGGHVWVESEPSRGAEFKIVLPETEPRPQPAVEEVEEAAPVEPASVLVVEDNPVVRLVLRKVLEAEHVITTAETPEEAIGLAEGGLAIDVLVTDIALPGMTGFELAERLCDALPQLKVLYVSAYDPEAYKSRRLLRVGVNFIPKPFDPDQLLQTLRRVVARGVGGRAGYTDPMLTRLRVSGFKNLVDVDLRFGPFTCVAGPNGVGKSNLFDAVRFLGLLADRPLDEAAREVRGGRFAGVRSLFHRVGETCRDAMSFEAEMIVPPRARDDLHQEAKATITFLRYSLTLARRPAAERGTQGPLEIVREELRHINRSDAHKHLPFKHSAKKWRSSAVVGERRAPYFISTAGRGPGRVVRLHQDGGGRGSPLEYRAAQLPRTVLSGTNAGESPTALIARREMQSWRLLQLEPSALRRPDELTAPRELGPDGSHLAATLYRLCLAEARSPHLDRGVYATVAERLAELVDDVRGVRVDRDERRALLTLQVIDRAGTEHPAPAISDGSLRFLALAVLELDPESRGLICVEEPENGVNPERIPAMLKLLKDTALDAERPVGVDNPLRQVIINTHSPSVVAQVPDDSLLVADTRPVRDAELGSFQKVGFHPLPDTWRARVPGSLEPVSLDKLLAHLNPLAPTSYAAWRPETRRRRVADRDDVQPLLPFGDGSG